MSRVDLSGRTQNDAIISTMQSPSGLQHDEVSAGWTSGCTHGIITTIIIILYYIQRYKRKLMFRIFFFYKFFEFRKINFFFKSYFLIFIVIIFFHLYRNYEIISHNSCVARPAYLTVMSPPRQIIICFSVPSHNKWM